MDRNALVTLVTQLVMEELSKSADGAAADNVSAVPEADKKKLILCGAPGSACEKAAWDTLRLLNDVRWIVVDWPGYPASRVIPNLGGASFEVVTPPEIWDDLVCSADGVLIPFAPLEVLAKLSMLITDIAPVSVAAAAVIQGIPVYAGGDDAERLTRHSARIPRAVISIVQEYARKVQSLGVLLDTPAQLAARFKGGVAALSSVSGKNGGRDVVTNEDVMAVMQAGSHVLEVSHGSIITSLARETAERFGIEVRFR